ncbi:acyl-CoA dehydrogenase family protein [Nocardioides sp. AE5]|uniref:acyl-CoA dehydrogenase family protein n=1 Tax=Nocardioides sp. AE5 TaxID=2962573 RepID=UPI00288114A9|nr:acyl-CoA dehydrogenase family protein [Nocardioides sp. AE5]MDT0202627.1 acyl-CoA dehydrogenase family protein [Nocardioides sp. AE5]
MFQTSARGAELAERMQAFLADEVYRAERIHAEQVAEAGATRRQPPVLEELKQRAKQLGLWNLFLPHPEEDHQPIANLDYAHIAELSGRSPHLAPEAINGSAPDTGNMELLSLFGTAEQKQQWLRPLMDGTMRSAYVMTEPQVASSDASNIETSIVRDGDEWVVNGRKWWISGVLRPQCELLVLLGITDQSDEAPRHRRHSTVLIPRDTPGVRVVRELSVLGYEPFESHVEMVFEDVRIPVENLLGEVGGGFAMSQARLGPGRIHHCMRMIGMAERALELMIDRVHGRSTFGVPLVDQGVVRDWIADSRMEIDQARLYVLYTAHLMDTVGNKEAASQISGIKVVVPNMAAKVINRAMQAFGGAGLDGGVPLARMYAEARIVRIADGPDEVHRRSLARTELRRFADAVTPRPHGLTAHLDQPSEERDD